MPVTFTPQRGAILLCDFGPDPRDPATFPLAAPPVSLAPEVWKPRRAIVVSPTALNRRHADRAGLCIVAPCSATPPRSPASTDVFFAVRSYRSFTKDVWVKCEALQRVSHDRLDRVLAGLSYRTEFLSPADLERVEVGLRAALGL